MIQQGLCKSDSGKHYELPLRALSQSWLFQNVCRKEETHSLSSYLGLFSRASFHTGLSPALTYGEETAGRQPVTSHGALVPAGVSTVTAPPTHSQGRTGKTAGPTGLQPGPAAPMREPRKAASEAGDAASAPRPAPQGAGFSGALAHRSPAADPTGGRCSPPLSAPAPPHLAAARENPRPSTAGSSSNNSTSGKPAATAPPAQRKEDVGETIGSKRRRGGGETRRFGVEVAQAVPRRGPGGDCVFRASSWGSLPSPGA